MRSTANKQRILDALIVVQRIAAAIDLLASSSKMGRVVSEVGNPDVREVIVGAYRVV
jgi:plasmid stabilization system protein ParE